VATGEVKQRMKMMLIIIAGVVITAAKINNSRESAITNPPELFVWIASSL
jgi:hypothetical protein